MVKDRVEIFVEILMKIANFGLHHPLKSNKLLDKIFKIRGIWDWKTFEKFQACFLMAISFQLNPEADLILVNNRVLVPS